MDPIAAINESSCALACIEATLLNAGHHISQGELIDQFRSFFPAWQRGKEGLMNKWEIPYLIELLGIYHSLTLFTNNRDEFLTTMKHCCEAKRECIAFLIHRRPTNHCNVIVSADVCAQKFYLMNPDQQKPKLLWREFQDIDQNNDPEYILLCK
jgi:hypothetical protein